MKKNFRTVFHTTANDYDRIIFSGGKVGYQVEVALKDLTKLIRYEVSDITED